MVSRRLLGVELAIVGLLTACLDPLPNPTPCAADRMFEEGTCVCADGLFERSDSAECTPCDAEDEVVVEDECVRCTAQQERVGDQCVDCPPLGVPAASCIPYTVAAAEEPSPDGCIDYGFNFDVYACVTGLSGPAAAEECAHDAPLVVGPACYARNEQGNARCPPEVIALGGADIVGCAPLSPDDIIAGDTGQECRCRSEDLLADCDGRGVVLGQVGLPLVAPDRIEMQPIIMSMPTDLQPAGRFGVYVRARGFAVPFSVLLFDPLLTDVQPDGWSFIVTNEYDQLVGFSVLETGIPISEGSLQGVAYDAEHPLPPYLVLALPDIVGPDQSAIVEVDCIIPFATLPF